MRPFNIPKPLGTVATFRIASVIKDPPPMAFGSNLFASLAGTPRGVGLLKKELASSSTFVFSDFTSPKS